MNDVVLKQIAPAPARRAGASRPFVMYTIVAVSSEAVHVFAPDYTTSKERTQFVVHDGATFTGFSGAPHEASPWYGWNEIIVLSGGAINCTGYAITQDFFSGPARDGERRLSLFGSIWVATGGILDLESCVSEGHHNGGALNWAKWSLLRYEAGATAKLGNLEGSTALGYGGYGKKFQSRIQCALDAGMEISDLDVSQCSRQCHHGGRPNSDCSACVDCDVGWDPAHDCNACLDCNGILDTGDCLCTCSVEGWSGPRVCDVNACMRAKYFKWAPPQRHLSLVSRH